MATTYRRPDRAVWSGQPWSTNVRQTSDYRRLQRNADTASHSQHILHSWDFGEEGRRTYEDVHVWMKLVFRIKNMNIHMFWKYFDICDIFCSFLKISYRIFLKSTVSCCCHPKDTSILSPSCWLQHGKKSLLFAQWTTGHMRLTQSFYFGL